MFLFIVGTGRCGTTLVHEMLCRHRRAGFISNIDDKLAWLNLAGRWNRAAYRHCGARPVGLRPLRNTRNVLERGRIRVAPSEGWNLLDRQVVSGFSRPCRDLVDTDATPWLRARLRAFFTERREAQGAEVLVHRLTGWPRVGLLRAALPEARFLHVVRDGRAVANSWLQMGWWDGYRGPDNWYLGPLPPEDMDTWRASGESFPVLAALGWQRLIVAHEEARAKVEPLVWRDVRYEDLLADPAAALPELLAFAGLERDRDFDRAVARHAVERSRADAFRRDLDETTIAAMEAAVGSTLDRWGYISSHEGKTTGFPSSRESASGLLFAHDLPARV